MPWTSPQLLWSIHSLATIITGARSTFSARTNLLVVFTQLNFHANAALLREVNTFCKIGAYMYIHFGQFYIAFIGCPQSKRLLSASTNLLTRKLSTQTLVISSWSPTSPHSHYCTSVARLGMNRYLLLTASSVVFDVDFSFPVCYCEDEDGRPAAR